MGQNLGPVTTLMIEAHVSPCAHRCRYCSIGEQSQKFPLDRWLSVMERFIEWAEKTGRNDLKIISGFFPSYNFDAATYVRLGNWSQQNIGQKLNQMPLGGLPFRSETSMSSWLSERQAAGLETVVASFVGHGSTHDRWNGRQGDFDFLMGTLRTAAELGLQHGSQLFLSKSSLPLLAGLIVKLDALPTPGTFREVRPFFHIGHRAQLEAERITEADRESLPQEIAALIEAPWTLRSEREWIELLHGQEETPKPVTLKLKLEADNIDRLERQSCGEIFDGLEHRARATLALFPSRHELCETYGDPNGTRIYMFADDSNASCCIALSMLTPSRSTRSFCTIILGAQNVPRLSCVEA